MRLKQLMMLVCIGVFSGISIANAELRVFTDQNTPIYNVPDNAQVIELDRSVRLVDELSVNLPNNIEQAEQIARSRLEYAGLEFQTMIQEALQAVVDAWSLGITQIPAVVVNRQYVVYGEPNVGNALLAIEAYQQEMMP